VYYAIEDDAWAEIVRRRLASMSTFADIASGAIEQIERDGGSAMRIRAASDVFAWLRGLGDMPRSGTASKEEKQ
jgi:hypothetical protein